MKNSDFEKTFQENLNAELEKRKPDLNKAKNKQETTLTISTIGFLSTLLLSPNDLNSNIFCLCFIGLAASSIIEMQSEKKRLFNQTVLNTLEKTNAPQTTIQSLSFNLNETQKNIHSVSLTTLMANTILLGAWITKNLSFETIVWTFTLLENLNNSYCFYLNKKTNRVIRSNLPKEFIISQDKQKK